MKQNKVNMELELEKSILQHIINGVEIEILNYKCDYVGIQYAKSNGHYYLNGELYITYDGGSTGKSLNDCRLLLLNLSDLTKEIEHNGEKFVPIEFLSQYPSLKLEDECKSIMSDNRWLNHCSYFLVSYLFEWHFDVFGLIEDGLAIDLNTINK